MWRGSNERAAVSRNRGFTLLETLISAALFSLVITGVYLLYTTMQNTMSRGELKSDLQQNARVGLDQMTREIRMAGYDPGDDALSKVTLQPKTAIRAASGGCLSFVTYSLDRSTSPATEKSTQITYDLSETTLRRRQDAWDGSQAFSGGSAQPLAESVNSLTFTYYDASNAVLTPYSFTSKQRCPPDPNAELQAIVQLDYLQLRQIRRVAITLQTRDSRPGVSSEFYTLTNDVRLRNR